MLGPREVEAEDARAVADSAKAAATELEAQAAQAEKAWADKANDAELRTRALAARDTSNASTLEAARLAALATYWEGSAATLRRQIEARETIRGDALRLVAAKEVSTTFRQTSVTVLFASLAVALGIFALAMAPKTTAAPAAPSLVTLQLNGAGRALLRCDAESVPALRIGGEDAAPEVITLPIDDCPSVTMKFTTTEPAGLGTVKNEELLTPPPSASGPNP